MNITTDLDLSQRDLLSFAAQVRGLRPGEYVSRVKLIDSALTLTEFQEALPALRQQFRNNIAPLVSRIAKLAGIEYVTETGEMSTYTGKRYLVCVISRKD